ncbi:hypothetical protein F5Y01DRAFT_322533 [Xylaria sp. FL0043]|nr:hypothetical protein F5Y01DRAFT_322533 [Xylaria sp. FL0043]
MDAAGARHVGAKLLGEVEDRSLEELLYSLRKTLTTTTANPSHPQTTPEIPIPDLSAIIARHHRATRSAPSPLISVSGRYLPFLYHLLSTLIAPPHNYAVVVVDAEGKFDITRLVTSTSPSPSTATAPSTANPPEKASYPASPADLAHVHIYRPARRGREHVDAVLASVQEYMVYGNHSSRGREWWGTVVVGGTGGGDVNAGWKGWLRVEREGVAGFTVGMSVEEALRERERRHEVVERAGWVAASPWGAYVWKGG